MKLPITEIRDVANLLPLKNPDAPKTTSLARSRSWESPSGLAPLAGSLRRRRSSEDFSTRRVRQAAVPTSPETRLSANNSLSASGGPSLDDLPAEVQHRLIETLRSHDIFQTLSDLHALRMTSTGLRDAVAGSIDLHYDELCHAVNEVNAFVSRMPDEILADAEVMRSLGTMLTFLSSPHRERLIALVAGGVDEEPSGRALGALGAAMRCLNDGQRERLVVAATRITDDWAKSDALVGLATGMGNLHPEQRQQLISVALDIGDEWARADALVGMGLVMAELSEPDHERLLACAIGIRDESARADALAGLGAGIANLGGTHRDRLFAAMMNLGNDHPKALALTGLAAGFVHLSNTQHELFVSVLEGTGNRVAKAVALRGLCTAMPHLSTPQRARIVAAVIAAGHVHNTRALAELGARLSFSRYIAARAGRYCHHGNSRQGRHVRCLDRHGRRNGLS
ncbi:hypothetical protein ABFU70_10855 [Xanthomonas campestris pv. campestris]|uniref:hypothetical protein n=1 Tax=Xanthomonas campestris TaxID=339 RepID=UPI00388F09D8